MTFDMGHVSPVLMTALVAVTAATTIYLIVWAFRLHRQRPSSGVPNTVDDETADPTPAAPGAFAGAAGVGRTVNQAVVECLTAAYYGTPMPVTEMIVDGVSMDELVTILARTAIGFAHQIEHVVPSVMPLDMWLSMHRQLADLRAAQRPTPDTST